MLYTLNSVDYPKYTSVLFRKVVNTNHIKDKREKSYDKDKYRKQ